MDDEVWNDVRCKVSKINDTSKYALFGFQIMYLMANMKLTSGMGAEELGRQACDILQKANIEMPWHTESSLSEYAFNFGSTLTMKGKEVDKYTFFMPTDYKQPELLIKMKGKK